MTRKPPSRNDGERRHERGGGASGGGALTLSGVSETCVGPQISIEHNPCDTGTTHYRTSTATPDGRCARRVRCLAGSAPRRGGTRAHPRSGRRKEACGMYKYDTDSSDTSAITRSQLCHGCVTTTRRKYLSCGSGLSDWCDASATKNNPAGCLNTSVGSPCACACTVKMRQVVPRFTNTITTTLWPTSDTSTTSPHPSPATRALRA